MAMCQASRQHNYVSESGERRGSKNSIHVRPKFSKIMNIIEYVKNIPDSSKNKIKCLTCFREMYRFENKLPEFGFEMSH